MKGNASCHLPSEDYRHNYDKIFGDKKEEEQYLCVGCGKYMVMDDIEHHVCESCQETIDYYAEENTCGS